MPYRIEDEDGRYSVHSPSGTKARRTTRRKAEAQVRLLNAIEHGFVPKKKRRGHHSCENGSFLDDRINKFNIQRN